LDVLITYASPKTKCPTRTPRRGRGKVTLRVERGTSLQENDLEPAFGQLFCCPTSGSAGTHHYGVVDHHVDTVTRLERGRLHQAEGVTGLREGGRVLKRSHLVLVTKLPLLLRI